MITRDELARDILIAHIQKQGDVQGWDEFQVKRAIKMADMMLHELSRPPEELKQDAAYTFKTGVAYLDGPDSPVLRGRRP